MARKPVQAPASFAGIPNALGGALGPSFGREIEIQEGVAIDGSDSALRTYSPFLIRIVLPNALGGDQSTVLSTGENPDRAPPSSSSTIRSDNRDGYTYAQGQNSARVDPSTVDAYATLVNSGNAVPGLTESSTRALEDAYNQARFQQVFGDQVQNVTHASQSNRTNNITPAITNDTTALSMALQLKRLSEVPPLLMLINPSSMKIDYTKVAQFQSRNRFGYIYEAWGEEMPKLSFTFKIGAYTAGLQSVSQKGFVASGVQRANRNDSASYQQLMTLLTMFHGATYIQDTVTNTRAFWLVGNLSIEYDSMVYVGHMENFSFSEDEQHPHGGLEITIDFVANRIYDVSDPVGEITPMTGPSSRTRSRGSLLQRGSGGTSVSLFTVPGIGGNSSISGNVNQAWEGAAGTTAGSTVGVNSSGEFAVLTTRRR
jgi:hypothetical protein